MKQNSSDHDETEQGKWGVHPDVLQLGLVSFLTDLSSEMIFAVFAVFFTTVAGASAALLGVIEGLSDFAASSLDYLAGWLSDRAANRKSFVLAGYCFSTLAKGILLVSSSILGLSIFRVIERLGKSFRGPSRDAWLSVVSSNKRRGYSFGVHRALDKAGAVLGPLIAYLLLEIFGDQASTYKILFSVSLIPALLSLVVLAKMKDPPAKKSWLPRGMLESWRQLSSDFKKYLFTAGLFSLSYFSFSFLLLRAYGLGFDIKNVILLYALFNLVSVILAPVGGWLSDRVGRGAAIMTGYLIYSVMCVGFFIATTPLQIIVLFVLFGVFCSIDEAQSKAFIADLEVERRATAIGLYNFICGVIYLPASLIAGFLWIKNPGSNFLVAAGISSCALLLFLSLRPDKVKA